MKSCLSYKDRCSAIEKVMLTVYGHAASSNVRKVLWTCHELGLDRLHKDLNGATLLADFPGYGAINPNGMVPAIDDDGFVLWESNAIIRYLATKHRRHDLLPEEPQKRALIEQWMDWQAGDFNNAWRDAFNGLVRKSVPSPSPAQIETSRQA